MSEITFDKPDPLDFLDIDSLLSEEEILLRDTVRNFVDKEIKPHVADWWDAGVIPHADLARLFGDLGYGEEPPIEFSRPEVARILIAAYSGAPK
jgi:alkylation response protein AidB-like acyl-CoA dehydrogenase